MDLLECFDPVRNTCPIIRSCRLKPMLYRARQAFLEVLDGYTVRDLARSSVERAALNVPPAQSRRGGSADTIA
jgi:Rrf2 family nitric oxide-sensitive transcriptional repressor